MNKTLFDNFDISFWHDSEYAQKYYVGTTPTNGQLKEVENELGYKLPQSYIALVQQHNGGMPINTCFPTQFQLVGLIIILLLAELWALIKTNHILFVEKWEIVFG